MNLCVVIVCITYPGAPLLFDYEAVVKEKCLYVCSLSNVMFYVS